MIRRFSTFLENYKTQLSPEEMFLANIRNDIRNELERTGSMKEILSRTPPSLEYSIQEIHELNKYTNISREDIQFALHADVDEAGAYENFCRNKLKVNIQRSFFENIFKQTDPIVFYLKDYFNRKRPFELANEFNIPFKVKIPISVNAQSYPGGHSLDSNIIKYVLTNLIPEKYKEIENFCSKMEFSRIYVGLHYPSDDIISRFVAQKIIETGKLKY